MKSIVLLLGGVFIGFGLTPFSTLHGEDPLAFDVSVAHDQAITVGDYVIFLRAVAPQEGDLSQLYHDELIQQIDRTWVEDHFDYQVREGVDENTLLTGLSQQEAECYYAWVENGEQNLTAATDNKVDGSPLMMFKVSEKSSEKKDSHDSNLSTADKTAQARRAADFEDIFHQQVQESQKRPALFGKSTEETSKEMVPPEDSKFRNTILQGIHDRLTRSEIPSYYEEADRLWEKRNETWERHRALHLKAQEATAQKIVFEKKLEEAKKANTAEGRDENTLGKIKKRIDQVVNILGYVPEPHAQLASVALGKVATATDWANAIFARINLAKKEFDYLAVKENEEIATQKAQEATITIIAEEKKIQILTQEALEKAKEENKSLLNTLHPQTYWGESEWQRWVSFLMDPTNPTLKISPQEIDLAQKSRNHSAWIAQEVGKAWKKRFQASEEQIQKAKSDNTKLRELQRNDIFQKKEAQEAEKISGEKLRYLQERREQQLLDQIRIDIFLEEHLKGNFIDQEKLKKERADFCTHFESLIQSHEEILRAEKAWEEALNQQSKKELQAFQASQIFTYHKEQQERLLERLKNEHKNNQELLRASWPQYDSTYRPYLEWELPFEKHLQSEMATPLLISPSEITATEKRGLKKEEPQKIESPELLQEEIEARGRRIYYRFLQSMQIGKNPSKQESLQKQPDRLPTTSLKKEAIQTKQEDQGIKKKPAAGYVKETIIQESQSTIDPEKELIQWSLEQLKDLSFLPEATQNRWKTRQELDALRKEIRTLEAAALDASHELENYDEEETGSVVSRMLKKAPSVISYFSRATKSTTSTTSSGYLTNSSESSRDQTIQKLAQAREKAVVLRNQWFQLIREAEQEREARTKISFETEDATIDAWEIADRKAVVEWQRRERDLQASQDALRLIDEWPKNNERWEARKEADELQEKVKKLQQENLGKRMKESERLRQEQKMTTLVEQVKQAEARWEELSNQHKSVLKAIEKQSAKHLQETQDRLKGFDQRVVRRWEKREQSKEEKPIDEQAEEKKQVPLEDYKITLQSRLKDYEQQSQGAYLDEEVKKYKEMARQEALRAAEEDFPGAVEGWQERILRDQEEISKEEEELRDPQTSPRRKRQINDLLPKKKLILQTDMDIQEIFLKEKNRLDRIENFWNSIEEGRREKELAEAKEAALHYEVDPTLWYSLSSFQRANYNDHIQEKNSHYLQEIQKEKTNLEMEGARLDSEEKRSQGFFNRMGRALSRRQEQALEQLQKALEDNREALEAVTKREECLKLGAMEEKEAEAYLSGQLLLELRKKEDLKNRREAIPRAKEDWKNSRKMYDLGRLYDRDSSAAHWNFLRSIKKGDDRKIQKGLSHKYDVKRLKQHSSNFASENYLSALLMELVGQPEIAILYRQSAEAYQQGVEVYQQHEDELLRGDEKAAALHEKRAKAWGGSSVYSDRISVATAYKEAADVEKALWQHKTGDLWCEFLIEYNQAARRGNKNVLAFIEAKLLDSDRADKQLQLAFDNQKAFEETEKPKSEIVALWLRSADEYKQQVEALLREDEAAAAYHENRAMALGEAADAYKNAAKAQLEGKQKNAALWLQSAEAREQEAEALLRGDEQAAEHHRTRAQELIVQARKES